MPRSVEASAIQFVTLAQQREAATLGIWVFLATEVLFFGGMILGYAVYRWSYPEAFAAAGRHTAIVLGTANTAVLLTSSLTMALAVAAAEARRRRLLVLLLLATAALGCAFLGIKAAEYLKDWHEHLVPALNFTFEPRLAGPAELFFLIYFATTGLHAIHLTIGIVVMLVLAARSRHDRYLGPRSTTVEIAGLYWHFVDIVWIFLFPLLYLGGRSG